MRLRLKRLIVVVFLLSVSACATDSPKPWSKKNFCERVHEETQELSERLPLQMDSVTQLVDVGTVYRDGICRIDYRYIVEETTLFEVGEDAASLDPDESKHKSRISRLSETEIVEKLQKEIYQDAMNDPEFSWLVGLPFVRAHAQVEFTSQKIRPFTVTWGTASEERQGTVESESVPTVRDEDTVTESKLCKAAIATIFVKDPSIISVTSNGSPTELSYMRKADTSAWKYRCRIEGRRIVWSGWMDGQWGRWRDKRMDSEITYRLEGKLIEISEQYVTGEKLVRAFQISEL